MIRPGPGDVTGVSLSYGDFSPSSVGGVRWTWLALMLEFSFGEAMGGSCARRHFNEGVLRIAAEVVDFGA
jgi:hypothetical protein